MSWKTQLSRNLPHLRFFCCTKSPSSAGIYKYYQNNYEELKMLNPSMPIMIRTMTNCMPAVVTDLRFTTNDVLRYMLQSNKFQNTDGSTNIERVEAAKSYLRTDWDTLKRERWACEGFDPEKPFLDDSRPKWRDDPKIASDLSTYLELRDNVERQMSTFKSGPDQEYYRAENALLMCQRVDLWCAGEKETEAAIMHLLKLGEKFNDYEPDFPEYITEFYPGVADL